MCAFAKEFRTLEPALFIMENLIVGTIALLLFGYLFVAMIWPEKF
jgi:K+-transporting ATPase KdpF subunit